MPDNRNPVFCAERVVDTGYSRVLDNNHVRLSLRQSDGQRVIKGIGFGLADVFSALKGRPFDVAFNLRAETWRGETVLAMQAKGFRESI